MVGDIFVAISEYTHNCFYILNFQFIVVYGFSKKYSAITIIVQTTACIQRN